MFVSNLEKAAGFKDLNDYSFAAAAILTAVATEAKAPTLSQPLLF